MENVNGIAVFGGTYPARIWAGVMKGALATVAEKDFPAPDRGDWPTTQYIDEKGRRYSTRYAQPAPPTTPSPQTAPPSSTATTATTKPAPTTVATVPPTTVAAPTTTSP
jgi:membrane peptidoglycan carboxypeptidase